MSRFSPTGNLIAGGSGGGTCPISVNRVTVASGGVPRWRDASTGIANSALGTLLSLPAPNWTPFLLDPKGATILGAGGGNYAATLSKAVAQTYGVFNGQPLPSLFSTYTALDGGPDGTLIFQSPDFTTINVLWGDGTVSNYPIGLSWNRLWVRWAANGFVYVSNNQLFWQPRGKSVVAIPTLEIPADPYLVLDPTGRAWVLYHYSSTWLHPIGQFTGYQLPGSFFPDIYVTGFEATVSTTPNACEAPETITLTAVTLGQGMKPLSVGPIPPDPPIPPVPPDPPVPPIPPDPPVPPTPPVPPVPPVHLSSLLIL